jgi:hypothetical protein
MAAVISDVLCSPWAEYDDIPARMLEGLPDDITQEDVEEQLMRASEILWALSGRIWLGGGCEETAILRSMPPPPGTGSWPYESSWGSCRCWNTVGWQLIAGLPIQAFRFFGAHDVVPIAVKLPRSPVTAVTSVTIDGDPFTAWNLNRAGWLERVDGKPWQLCDNSTEIVYQYGEAPPGGGRDAAIELGLELVRYRFGLDDCRIPRRATQITRQALTITVDPTAFLNEGGTGLVMVDMWLRSVNPGRQAEAATVWSPDLPTTMRG